MGIWERDVCFGDARNSELWIGYQKKSLRAYQNLGCVHLEQTYCVRDLKQNWSWVYWNGSSVYEVPPNLIWLFWNRSNVCEMLKLFRLRYFGTDQMFTRFLGHAFGCLLERRLCWRGAKNMEFRMMGQMLCLPDS